MWHRRIHARLPHLAAAPANFGRLSGGMHTRSAAGHPESPGLDSTTGLKPNSESETKPPGALKCHDDDSSASAARAPPRLEGAAAPACPTRSSDFRLLAGPRCDFKWRSRRVRLGQDAGACYHLSHKSPFSVRQFLKLRTYRCSPDRTSDPTSVLRARCRDLLGLLSRF
jgi:hypothetical protein